MSEGLQPPRAFFPLDLEQAAQPFEALAELTRTCPVSRQTRAGFDPITLATGYAAVTDVYQRRGDFNNTYGHSIVADPGQVAERDRNHLFFLDGEAHRRVRRIVVSALTPRQTEAATPYMTELSRSVVAAIPDTGRAELRAAWATRIPGKVVAHMIGVPEDDHDRFFGWTMQKMATISAITQKKATLEDLRRVEVPFNEYLAGQVRQRREAQTPPDDILTRLIQLRDEAGNGLSEEEILGNSMFLLNAGNQTSQNLLVNLVHQLITEGLWKRVRGDRSLVPAAIEESLRLLPPIQYGVRRPYADSQVGGCPVSAGAPVVLSNLAANRDPAAWGEDAAKFRLDRNGAVKHLGFGMGPHACIGSAVARRIAEVAMNALLDRFESLSLAPEFRWKRQSYWTSMGIESLEVTWP